MLSPPKPLDLMQPNLVCELITCMGRAIQPNLVCELITCMGRATAKKLARPLGPWGGVKRSNIMLMIKNSVKRFFQSIFQTFEILTDFFYFERISCPKPGGGGGGGGGVGTLIFS